MDICVFGAGSLGSLVGGLLAHQGHEVTLVGRDPHVAAIRERGLSVRGECNIEVHPAARTSPPATTELAIVTTKAQDVPAAAEALQGVPSTVLCLANGMGGEERLADRLAAPVLAGRSTYGADQTAPGVVECTGLGEIVLGPPAGGTDALADRVGEAFTPALENRVVTDMPWRRWEKLAVNAGINAPTALARVTNGALADEPGRELARSAALEVARVARAEGVELGDEQAVAALEQVVAETTTNRSSMYQDVAAGRQTEVDAISGFVIERATAQDIETPVNETLTRLIRGWELAHDLREPPDERFSSD
jgi:2-dehydropantoate 2-reductase